MKERLKTIIRRRDSLRLRLPVLEQRHSEFAVTLIQTRTLRSSRTMTKANSRSKPIVGTTNRSMAAMSGACCARRFATPGWAAPVV